MFRAGFNVCSIICTNLWISATFFKMGCCDDKDDEDFCYVIAIFQQKSNMFSYNIDPVP